MDDNAKNASSYHLDQEILDARGIAMTVEEVAGLPTIKYSVRVQSLHLSDENLAFLKGLRRRIKNRLASQNSRRRSMEHLKRLTRELRAVRARRDDALAERKALLAQRGALRDRCQRLRHHVVQTLNDRLDTTEVPPIDINLPESQAKSKEKAEATALLPQCEIARDKNVFECRLDKLVQHSVNHIFKTDKKKIYAKTVFLSEDRKRQEKNVTVKYDSPTVKLNSASVKFDSVKFNSHDVKFHNSDVRSVVFDGFEGDIKGVLGDDEGEVLNLSVKEGRRKSHGRKQSAPRRIAYVEYEVSTEDVLDLKVKKEPQ